ncbi:MAG: DUF418 domain-containing protein [Acidobacteria bacterium]|nr:DUF418 domain-containing protein [Acidobacteriota bacterium]
MQAVGPVLSGERISSLDTIRGFALLGILLMNIVGFGLPYAYDDPANSGGSTGINLWIWIVMHILAEGKMRCLFSMVFGAGIILLTSRAEQRAGASSSADIYYQRNLWLGGFGILHAFLLWQGEILYPYALCALALYPFRRMAPKGLISIAAAMMLIITGLTIYDGMDTKKTIAEGKAAEEIKKGGASLTEDQEASLRKWEDLRKHVKPSSAEIEKTKNRWRGGVVDVLKVRAETVWHWHSLAYYHYRNLDIFSMMLLGMAFFKLGVFSGTRSFKFYVVMAGVGYAIGLSINSYTAYTRVANNFDIVVNIYSGVTYDIGRLSIALAHAGILMLLMKAGMQAWLTRSLGAIGQMALSNYLTHSVVCSTIFCGYGFGMYGRLERYQLYYIVAALWIFQMIVSPIWLRHFHFGPAEWAWRSLTYWQKQPMRKLVPQSLAAEAS